MVHLSRIYTRSGDDGSTGLGDGARVPKHHPRIAAYGTTDELSSVLGLALAEGVAAPWDERLRAIQNELFDVGADLCVPAAEPEAGGHEEAGGALRVTAAATRRLEAWIDEANEGLAPLDSFVLPGGTKAAAWMHLARCVCRRAERHVCELIALEDEAQRTNPEVLRYLNRLSDLLFVVARVLNDGGRADVLWKPGASQG